MESIAHTKAIYYPYMGHSLCHTISILGPYMAHITRFGKGIRALKFFKIILHVSVNKYVAFFLCCAGTVHIGMEAPLIIWLSGMIV